VAIIMLLLFSSSIAGTDDLQEMTVVVPAQSIARAIEPLLPYKIDLGNNFVGSFFVKSIKDVRIKNDRILFSSLISGKDIKYATKVGKQVVNFVVGDVNLPSNWEVSFKFDKAKKKLLIIPYSQEVKDEDKFSQGDALLNALLTAFSGIEYPVDLNNLEPVQAELYNQILTVNMNVSDIYAADNKLFVEIVPIARVENLKKQ
jgi:hypothetical protein